MKVRLSYELPYQDTLTLLSMYLAASDSPTRLGFIKWAHDEIRQHGNYWWDQLDRQEYEILARELHSKWFKK
jgi:hypothetical protein